MIRLSADGRERLRDLFSQAVIDAADATATQPDERGWITAVVPIESLEHAQVEFLRLGADVEIIAPARLRDRMAGIAGSLAAMYRNA
jgi:predicted DNA-binding transcriptional regulator YafY